MLVIVEAYKPQTSVEDAVTAPGLRYRYIDLERLVQDTRRVRMTVDIFNRYYKTFISIVGSLRYQEIIPGREFDHSRYLIRGFDPNFRIQILAYLRLLEPHHSVDQPWNLKTVCNSAISLLKLTEENDYGVAPPGDGTFYSGSHSLFRFLARYSNAEELTESNALQFAMDKYIQDEIDLGRFDDVAQDEDAAYQLLRTTQLLEDSESACQPPSTVIRNPMNHYAPSHKRDSLDPTSGNAQTLAHSLDDATTVTPFSDLTSLPRHLRERIQANTLTSTNTDPKGHRLCAPLTTYEHTTVSSRGSIAIRHPDECSFCSQCDGPKVRDCPVARDYIARGLCHRDPVYHHLDFPDGTRLTRQAPGANFRTSVDMWHSRRSADSGYVAVTTPRRMGNAYDLDNKRERSLKLEHGVTQHANRMATAAAESKASNSTMPRSARSTPVISSLGMSIVGTY